MDSERLRATVSIRGHMSPTKLLLNMSMSDHFLDIDELPSAPKVAQTNQRPTQQVGGPLASAFKLTQIGDNRDLRSPRNIMLLKKERTSMHPLNEVLILQRREIRPKGRKILSSGSFATTETGNVLSSCLDQYSLHFTTAALILKDLCSTSKITNLKILTFILIQKLKIQKLIASQQ